MIFEVYNTEYHSTMATARDESKANQYQTESTSSLILPVEELLGCKAVEKQRIEFKKAWHNERNHNRGTYWQILHTISAYANDYFNENGGYVVIGVKESGEDSSRDWEVCGVAKTSLDMMQQEIRRACKKDIVPSYSPIISPEVYKNKHVLVLWAQAGDDGPYECRESAAKDGHLKYYIRKGPETCAASTQERQSLLMRKNKIPFDDRMARDPESNNRARLTDIDYQIFLSFLNAVGSKLLREKEEDKKALDDFRKYKLVIQWGHKRGTDGELKEIYVPRNFSLLFFNQYPHNFFRGAKIEVAWYKGKSKKVIREERFEGPLHVQIKKCRDLILEATQEEFSCACISYPQQALTEALVNAVYHRGYEPEHPDPVKVHISPDGRAITSYPGPDSCLREEQFNFGGTNIPLVPARNRRIGEILKELKLAEMRGAGVPAIYDAMQTNQNPPPKFAFNERFFKVTLPSHPVYQTQLMLSEVDKLVASGEKKKAFESLLEFIKKKPSACSDQIAQKLVQHFSEKLSHSIVKEFFQESRLLQKAIKRQPLIKDLNDWEIQHPLDINRGVDIIQKLVELEGTLSELTSATRKAYTLCRESGPQNLQNLQNAHKLFEAMGPTILQSNARAAFQYASCKFNIFFVNRKNMESLSRLDYLQTAEDYANKALQLTQQVEKNYRANQLRLLGEVKYFLIRHEKATPDDVRQCFSEARQCNPDIRISQSYDNPEAEVHRRRRALSPGKGRGKGRGQDRDWGRGRSRGRDRGRGRGRGGNYKNLFFSLG